MSDPLISIITPAYKAERFIGETLASVRAQSFPDWEIVIVEDGSHDGTEDLVKAFAATVSQPVIFSRHEKNQGLPATRNTAIARARGEWIALLDSDDLWTTDHLEKAVARLRETGADLVHSAVLMFDSDSGRELEVRAPSPAAVADFPRSLFLSTYIIQPSSVVMRRALCQQVGGFNPECRYLEDKELWLRLVRAGARIERVSTTTCHYRQHAAAMTKNAAAMAEGAAYVYERNLDWNALPRSLRRERAADARFSAGRILLRSDPRRARAHFAQALRHRPWCVRLLAYFLAASLLGLTQTGRRPTP